MPTTADSDEVTAPRKRTPWGRGPWDCARGGGLLVLATVWLTVLDARWSIAAEPDPLKLTPTTVVHFATAEEARAILVHRDEFVQALSEFDRSVRLKTSKPVSERDHLEFVGKQALDWKDADRQKLTAVVAAAAKRFDGWTLPLPTKVTLVCTTGEEEGDAYYCRGPAIIIPRGKVASDAAQLERVLLHELFHVLSSHNPKLRDRMYSVVGFTRCGPIELPTELAKGKITNPDAPTVEHTIELDVDGKKVQVAPVLYSATDYDDKRGGGLFQYLRFELLAVESVDGKTVWQKVDGKPRLLNPGRTPAYLERIGRNTTYIIHPEEILADNFQQLLLKEKASSPKIHEGLEQELKSAGDRPELER